MVKVDLITGFLGSGKTTFIRKYAQYLMDTGNNIGILENDYGAVNVDMMLLQDLMGDNCELEMISGGCDKDCHRRRFKTKLIAMGMCGYDRVIVEPSGIFDVDEFFDILHEEPLNRWYQIGNVIAIVDSKLESDLSDEADFILASEVADAGCIVMSKSQDATPEEIQGTIEHVNCVLEKVHCSRRFGKDFDGSVEAGVTNNVIHKNWDEMSKEDFDRIASCGYEMASYRKPEFEAEDAFTSLYFMNVKMAEKELREAAEKILSDPACGHVFRMKGFMRVDDGEISEKADQTQENGQHWIELNATKNEITIRPLHVGQEVLIVIGEGLQEDKIKSYLKI
ncbi:GTP-binding protein [Blautia sp. MSJ-9]|uniref:GTP-binding protein n=1 Tax=Blautia sp. MSJ-9 TaxID=2841511 RepID=UPI001C115F33|nr:GTP-binding protein [Blautia sp. MSJ-9]MBU5679017.1 GTPase (G3E family) [Blautia sp. MSJ-9]